jgi:uncharacterized protein YndB with AHSA1/START domain
LINKQLEEQFDFVLVEGTSFSGEGTVIELDMNVLIIKTWDSNDSGLRVGKEKHWSY